MTTTEKAPTPENVTRSKAVSLTERDRELLALLALARFLTTAQLTRLVFPGVARPTVSRRLHALAGEAGFDSRAPYLRETTYRTYEGKLVQAWTLTERGYVYAEQRLGSVKVSAVSVGVDYLEHIVLTNDLLVEVLAVEKGHATAAHSNFRWIGPETLRLASLQYDRDAGEKKKRLLLPDAGIELPQSGRRVFLEYESGNQPLADPRKPGATISKLGRYDHFLAGYADPAAKLTWYARHFQDGLTPELLFVVPSESRRDSIINITARWRAKTSSRIAVTAMTVSQAAAHFRELLGRRPVQNSRSTTASGVAESDIVALERFVNEALSTIQRVRHAVRDGQRIQEPAYPSSSAAATEILKRLKQEAR